MIYSLAALTPLMKIFLISPNQGRPSRKNHRNRGGMMSAIKSRLNAEELSQIGVLTLALPLNGSFGGNVKLPNVKP